MSVAARGGISSLGNSIEQSQAKAKREANEKGADGPKDCLSCRVVGTGALTGTGVVSFVEGRRYMMHNRAAIQASRFGLGSRYIALATISSSMIGLGVYRWYR